MAASEQWQATDGHAALAFRLMGAANRLAAKGLAMMRLDCRSVHNFLSLVALRPSRADGAGSSPRVGKAGICQPN